MRRGGRLGGCIGRAIGLVGVIINYGLLIMGRGDGVVVPDSLEND